MQYADPRQCVAYIGIGQTCARLAALNGCQKLFLVDLSLDKLKKTASLIESDGLHSQVELYDGSVADEMSVKGMIDRCVEVFGRVDIAFNNAGVSGAGGRTHEVSMVDFDLACSVNERGVSGLTFSMLAHYPHLDLRIPIRVLLFSGQNLFLQVLL